MPERKDSMFFPSENERENVQLIHIVEKKFNILVTCMQRELSSLVSENKNIVNPQEFHTLIEKEAETFLSFLKTKSMEVGSEKGIKAAADGLEKKIVISLPQVYQSFFLTHIENREDSLLRYALDAVNIYMFSYLSSYVDAREEQIRKEQKRLYERMIETVSFREKALLHDKKEHLVDDEDASTQDTQPSSHLKPEIYDEIKKTILVVEENTEHLSYLQENMIDEFNFYYALNGKDALGKLEIIPKPDVIISDIMMDIMDGYEFLCQLREKSDMQDIPFIFFTSKATEEDTLKGLRLGAVDYIEKPFSLQILKEKIRSLIRDHDIYSEKEVERIGKRLLKTIRLKESTQINFELLYTKYNLSKREREILQYIIKGMESKDIAGKLFISYDTVKRHIQNLKEKCNVKNLVQLINLFRE
jgi:DNA-binding NarL/FixJ family response regulator